MAESAEVDIIGSKSAQELALNPENVPNNYIYKEGGVGFRDALLPSESDDIDIPVVDIANLASSSPSTEQQEELLKLHSALSSWGLFQSEVHIGEALRLLAALKCVHELNLGPVEFELDSKRVVDSFHSSKHDFTEFGAINHGMTSLFLDKVREISKQFFDLPKEEKQKYSREPNGIEGYGNDVIFSENQKLDWTDRVYLKVHPEDQRNLKLWPQKPDDFRNTIEQYNESLRQLYEVILRAIAKSLNLEEDCFLKECGEGSSMFMRFNYYPPCPMPDHVLGVKPHADGSSITFLLQDKEVEGLQVLKDNQWFKVPIIPDALVINVGDQIEIMSNGIFQSPVHRVVTNAEKERLTVATFCIPDSEKEIKPVDKLVSESRPILYRPVKNFVDIYFQYYQKGRRPIEASKINY